MGRNYFSYLIIGTNSAGTRGWRHDSNPLVRLTVVSRQLILVSSRLLWSTKNNGIMETAVFSPALPPQGTTNTTLMCVCPSVDRPLLKIFPEELGSCKPTAWPRRICWLSVKAARVRWRGAGAQVGGGGGSWQWRQWQRWHMHGSISPPQWWKRGRGFSRVRGGADGGPPLMMTYMTPQGRPGSRRRLT